MIDLIKISIEKAKLSPKKIVFPESQDERTLRAVDIVANEGIAYPILLGDPAKIKEDAARLHLKLEGVKIVHPQTSPDFSNYSKVFFELRKGKVASIEDAEKIMMSYNYFGTMMIKMGDADGLISGAVSTTAETVRPALEIIKTKEAFRKVSGVFFMVWDDKMLLFADAAVNINPDAKDLADIAIDTAETAKEFGIEPRIAMLSFSTKGSSKHPNADKVIEATKIVQYRRPDLIVDGELQVDAALVPEVCQKKCPGSKLKGQANILIFPDLQAGNISYKLVERLGKAQAIGPILQGLARPVNDLSRGCSVEDIVHVTAITVVQAQKT